MADRIVVLNGGRVEQIGAPLDLYDRPANRFVAGFIGSPSMNFLEGTITSHGFATAGVTLPSPGSARSHVGRPAIFGIRPEHLRLDPAGAPAEVLLVEPMGAETQVTMTLGNTQVIGVFRERIALSPGSVITVIPDAAAVHLFDADGGQRLE